MTRVIHSLWPWTPDSGCAAICAVLLCVLGMQLFRKRAGEMVDEL